VGGIGVGDAASAFFGFWTFGFGSVPPGDFGAFFFGHTSSFSCFEIEKAPGCGMFRGAGPLQFHPSMRRQASFG
jgi:hypothetical protein